MRSSSAKRFGRVLTALSITATAFIAVLVPGSSPAAAAPVPIPANKCDDNLSLCFYSADKFRGTEYGFWVETSNCHNFNVLGGSNTATSIINPSWLQYYVYDSSNCTGSPMATIYARTANDNIGPANNDRISSFRTTGPLP